MSPLLVCPRRFSDSRGWFSETFNDARLKVHGIDVAFCQDNQSYSAHKGTLRGLHFQSPPHAQAKLVRCIRGRIIDIAVDIRRASPTFGQWVGAELSAENGKQLFVPTGYAHGFLTLEPDCEIAYKVDDYYSPECDGGISWNDPAIGIDWASDVGAPVFSDKDGRLPPLAEMTFEFDYDGVPLEPLREVVA